MTNLREHFYLSPTDYYNSCNTLQKQELANCLIEDGLLQSNDIINTKKDSFNDLIFKENLESLMSKRHLLTLDEENFINNLSNKFNYL
jgi:hypothetical protein